ncbi:MAG: hypothetical protein LKK12_05495 [Bacteroidales bacterium]|jgi:hypothetical protein|nr:hypothetical protein [Bacteroidales bacterium]MCI2133820.1 hypothetical protein [Bacteroidales bacterium]
MLTTILGAICALALNASPAASQADTVNVYMINGEKIENFDGRQLVGKTISTYRIAISKSNSTGKITKVHMINTTESLAKSDGNGVSENTVYVVDGVKTSPEGFAKITPSEIGSITVCKAGSKEAKEWTDDATAQVIKVETKKDGIFIVNGKEVSSEEFFKLKPKVIASMTILKAGSKAAAKYTDSKDKNVIVVESKK